MNVRSSLLLIASALNLAGANCDGGEPPAPDAGVIVADPCSEDADCTGGLRCSTNGLCEAIPACSLAALSVHFSARAQRLSNHPSLRLWREQLGPSCVLKSPSP